MESRAVLMMNTLIKPASKGSNGNGEGALSKSGGNTNSMEYDACKKGILNYNTQIMTPPTVPSSPTSSSDGSSGFSFSKEADLLIESFRVEAGMEGGIKDTDGKVSGVGA